METRRRAGSIVEYAGFAQRESEGDGPALFPEQRRLVTDREDRLEIGGRGKRRVDLSCRLRLTPPNEHALGEVRGVREVATRDSIQALRLIGLIFSRVERHVAAARLASSMKVRQTRSKDGTRFPSSWSRSNVNS
jgi:hypothetical protein